jgi:CHAT domain-containing protein
MALSRTFLSAGARSVVATQWSIPDAAGGVMPSFYRGLITGGDATHELRKAKLEFRGSLLEGANGQLMSAANPIYWAPFILMGYPRLTLAGDGRKLPVDP